MLCSCNSELTDCRACCLSLWLYCICAEQLPPHSLEQALLLCPELLNHLLESAAAAAAAAAAALRPILQHTPDNHAAAATGAVKAQHPDAPSCSSSGGGVGAGKAQHLDAPSPSSSSGGGGGGSSAESLLSASCPWMESLPAMLAQHPLLLLKVCPQDTALALSDPGLCPSAATATSKGGQESCRNRHSATQHHVYGSMLPAQKEVHCAVLCCAVLCCVVL
jgi:hypothetical protein